MKKKKLEKLLTKLSERTEEPVRRGLAEDIKSQIPHKLFRGRKRSWDTINIIVDLRISRLAAAAIIIVATILLVNFIGPSDLISRDMYEDSKRVINYYFSDSGFSKDEILATVSNLSEYLASQGKKIIYYNDKISPKDKDEVMICWELPSNDKKKYKLIFADLRTETVSAEELIKLQFRTQQRKRK